MAVGGVEERVVEPVEVLWPEPPQPDPPDCWHDVQVGLVQVPAVGDLGELEVLGRQPLGGEVGTEAERTDLVVAAVALRCQPSDETLGFGPVGAGRVPGSTFSAGDGVESFVDDGVEPAATLCEVSLHRGLLSLHRTKVIRWNDR